MNQITEKTSEEDEQNFQGLNDEAITYGIIEETYSLESYTRTSYGIAAYADFHQAGIASIIASVHDVTADKERLQQLIGLCNSLQLSPNQLTDVIEDFLGT